MLRTYTGRIEIQHNGEGEDILALSGDEQFLSERVQEDLEEFGQYVSSNYFTSKEQINEEDVVTEWLKTLYGLGEARYCMRYTETTGYLWTDSLMSVGGHDLMAELKSHVGEWLVLRMDYSQDPKMGDDGPLPDYIPGCEPWLNGRWQRGY